MELRTCHSNVGEGQGSGRSCGRSYHCLVLILFWGRPCISCQAQQNAFAELLQDATETIADLKSRLEEEEHNTGNFIASSNRELPPEYSEEELAAMDAAFKTALSE